MSTELPVVVELPESWAAFADPEARAVLTRAVAAALDGVLGDFGIPSRAVPEVTMLAVDRREHPAEPCLQMRAAGDVWRCAPELAAQVHASLLAVPLRAAHFATPAWLTDGKPDAAARTHAIGHVSALCAGLARQHPASLLTSGAAQAVAGELPASVAAVAGDDLAALETILRHLLACRIGIADRQSIASQWERGHAARLDPGQIAETLVDNANGPQIRILTSPATLRALTADAGAPPRAAAQLRENAYFDLGLRFPDWQLEVDDSLPQNAFAVAVGAHRSPVQVGLNAGEWLERVPSAGPSGPATPASTVLLHPRTLAPHVLHATGFEPDRDDAIGPLEYMLLCLDATLRELAPCFVLRGTVEAGLLRPATVGAALARVFRQRHTLESLTQVLRRLAAERVSIRNLRRIVESMCNFETVVADGAALIVFDDRLAVRAQPDSAWLADPRTLTAFARTALKRQITQATLGGKSRLEVFLVDSDIERALAASARPDARQPGNGRLPETVERALLRGMHAELGWSIETRAPVFLTTAEARAPLRALLADQWPAATVVAYQELRADSTIHPLGRISLVY